MGGLWSPFFIMTDTTNTPRPKRPKLDDRPAINAEWLERMRTTKPEFLLRLFEVFMAEEPKRLAALVGAVTQADLEQVRYLAHSLKGAAASLGMERLRDACRELEFAAKDADTSALAKELVPVAEEMERIFKEIRRVMSPV